MVSKHFMETQFKNAGIVKGSKDHTQFQVGMDVINRQPKLLTSTRNEMIKILREFVEI